MNNTRAILTSKISQAVKDNGSFLVANWLEENDQEMIYKYIKKNKPKKGTNDSLACTSNKDFIIEFFKLNYEKINISLLLKKIEKKLELKKIAEQIFENKAKIIRTDFYYNQISSEPVLDWHCDAAYSGRENIKNFLHPDDYSIKFFFYLSDVFPDNGCLSYIPKSNIITYAVRKGIFEKKIPYSPYWSLKDLRNLFKSGKSKEYLINEVKKEDIDIFMKQSMEALSESNNNNKFDFSLKKGGAIVFDESGIHRGSCTKFSERLVLRFFYKRA